MPKRIPLEGKRFGMVVVKDYVDGLKVKRRIKTNEKSY